MIDTPMLPPDPKSAGMAGKLAAAAVLGRLGRPEEISSLVVYLASD